MHRTRQRQSISPLRECCPLWLNSRTPPFLPARTQPKQSPALHPARRPPPSAIRVHTAEPHDGLLIALARLPGRPSVSRYQVAAAAGNGANGCWRGGSGLGPGRSTLMSGFVPLVHLSTGTCSFSKLPPLGIATAPIDSLDPGMTHHDTAGRQSFMCLVLPLPCGDGTRDD